MLNHWDEGVWGTPVVPVTPIRLVLKGVWGLSLGPTQGSGVVERSLDWQSRRETGEGADTGPYMSCKLPNAAEISSGGLLWLALAPSQAPHTQSKDPKGIFVSPSNTCPAHRFLHRQSGLQLRARGGASTGQDRGMVTSGQVSAWLPSQWDRTWPPGRCLGTDGGGTGMGITGKGGGSSRS